MRPMLLFVVPGCSSCIVRCVRCIEVLANGGSTVFSPISLRKDIPFCPLVVFRKGKERLVLRSFLIFRAEFLMNNSEKCSFARPFSDSYMMVAVPILKISLIIGHL